MEKLRLDGKVAVVTGGASGIGAATVRKFATHGARVVIADIQDDMGNALAVELGPNVSYIRCDVSEESDVAAAVDLAVSKYGSLDIMFNNAGILASRLSKSILFAELDMVELERILKINVYGVIHGVKHAARIMIPSKSGSIISTASLCHLIPGLAFHPYTISKHAIIGITKSAASELCHHGIRVNSVSPGGVATPLLSIFGKEVGANSSTRMDPEHVAEAVLYLASDLSKCVIGHDLVVDNGWSMVAFKNIFGESLSATSK